VTERIEPTNSFRLAFVCLFVALTDGYRTLIRDINDHPAFHHPVAFRTFLGFRRHGDPLLRSVEVHECPDEFADIRSWVATAWYAVPG